MCRNWRQEFYKWCGNKLYVLGVSGEGKAAAEKKIALFRGTRNAQGASQPSGRGSSEVPSGACSRRLPAWMRPPQVLVVSYETARIYAPQLAGENRSYCCDLMIFDEAHRLKNEDSQGHRELARFPCKRKVLLTGVK